VAHSTRASVSALRRFPRLGCFSSHSICSARRGVQHRFSFPCRFPFLFCCGFWVSAPGVRLPLSALTHFSFYPWSPFRLGFSRRICRAWWPPAGLLLVESLEPAGLQRKPCPCRFDSTAKLVSQFAAPVSVFGATKACGLFSIRSLRSGQGSR
jgi:hypothetical protein